MGLRAGIESLGPVFPSLIEISYLLMYVVPPFSIAAFYILRKRERIELYMFPFLLGTLSAYAMISHFPSGSPRVEHAGLDMPNIFTVWRQFNIWILNHGDIQTSVFPSGHVTAAFSAAFGMILALPERPWFGRTLLINAFLILVATVYGRYHYAADGIAGLAISLTALCITLFLRRGSVAPAEDTADEKVYSRT
jgi:membrane-associated phospholipid phosphatase